MCAVSRRSHARKNARTIASFATASPVGTAGVLASCDAMDDDRYFARALEQARAGAAEGGIPIGAALVGGDGRVLGLGHNRRVQDGSAIRHGEMDALEAAG